ncbi:MAG TPA: HNH endonuclease [Methylococcales bacterium]
MAQKIELTRGLFAIVDDEDFVWLNSFRWYAHRLSGYDYAERGGMYNGVNTKYPMHRFILNAQKGQIVDHKNGNTLDNRRCNLRFATYQQNNQNAKKRKNCTSIYKGVSWNKACKRWDSFIKHNGKSINLGQFDNEILAAKVYDKRATELRGEFARLNFGGN